MYALVNEGAQLLDEEPQQRRHVPPRAQQRHGIGLPVVGVTLLHRQGYFVQRLDNGAGP